MVAKFRGFVSTNSRFGWVICHFRCFYSDLVAGLFFGLRSSDRGVTFNRLAAATKNIGVQNDWF
jgi:hypothetical protein